MKKFIIIASQRTGSNMLVSALDSLPDVCCHGELFRKRLLNKSGALAVLDSLDPRYEDINFRERNFQDYLDSVISLNPPCPYFGFKIMLNQSNKVINYCIKNESFKKILLVRENILAVFSSEKIAQKTRQGNVKSNEPVIKAKITFNINEFEAFMSRYIYAYKNIREQLKKNSLNSYLEVDYIQLQDRGINKVVNYLDLKPDTHPITISTKKRNSNHIAERFENSQDVIGYLKYIKKTHWLTETV